MSSVGVDLIVMDEVEHIAFAPSAYSTDTIPTPEEHHDDHEGHDDDDDYVFYCSNDGEEYANSMGGILCPEDAGEIPTCPDGEPCICIDVDGSCTDGDDDWGYEDHDNDGHDDTMK